MRAFLLSLSLSAACLSIPVSAQNLQAYGFRGGVNTSNVGFELADGDRFWLDNRSGFQLAAFAEVALPVPLVSALVEAEYAQRSYRWPEVEETAPGDDGGVWTGQVNLPASTLQYASVPVLAKVEPAGLGGLTPYLLVGPRLDVLVGRSVETVTRGGSQPVEFRDDLPDALDTVALTGVVGAGVGLGGLIGPEVRVEARYGFGLTNLVDSDTIDWKARGLDFSLALAF